MKREHSRGDWRFFKLKIDINKDFVEAFPNEVYSGFTLRQCMAAASGRVFTAGRVPEKDSGNRGGPKKQKEKRKQHKEDLKKKREKQKEARETGRNRRRTGGLR